MAQSYADVSAVQIEAITPLLTGFFDEEMGLFERFEKIQSKSQSGRNMRMPIELRPGGTLRAVNLDNGALGTGSGPIYDYQEMSPVDTVFALSWSLKSKFTTDSDQKAVVDTVQRTLASGIEGAKIHVDKHLQTAGMGALAVMTSYSDNGTASVCTCANSRGVRLIRVGDQVTFYSDTTQGTHVGTVDPIVTAVDYQAKTFTVNLATASTGAASTTTVAVGGLTAATPTYIWGLPYHQNNSATGTWMRWNRANYPECRTPTYDAGGNNLTLEAINTLLANLDGELGETVTDTGNWIWYMAPKQHQQLITLMTMISEIELGSAQKGGNPEVDLTFNRKRQRRLAGFEVVTSINADPTRVDFIDTKNWLRGTYKDLAFQKLGGSTVLPVPNSTSYNATEVSYLLWSHQFAMRNPRRGAYISNLAVPA